MEINQTRALLRINGVPDGATPEVITEVLLKAQYTKAEIEEFFAQSEALKNGTPMPEPVVHVVAATEYAPEAFSVPKPPPKKSNLPRVVLTLLLLILVGGGAYTAYAVYGVSPEQAILGGTLRSTQDEKFHLDIDIHTVATSTSEQLKITMGMDVDSTNPEVLKVNATPALDSALFAGSVDLRLIGESYFVKINKLLFLGEALPQQPNWYEGTLSELKHSSLPMGPGPFDPNLLLKTSTTSATDNLQTLFDNGIVTPVGGPELHLVNNRPVITYHFAVDGDKLTPDVKSKLSQTPSVLAHATVMQYGPVVVTKDFFTGKLISVEGTASSMSTALSGEKKTTAYAYRLGYRTAAEVTIAKPDQVKPISTLKDSLRSSVEDGMAAGAAGVSKK